MAVPPINVLSLFSGGGGLELGLRAALPQARVVCHVERESYACAVLAARMEEGKLAPAPIWSCVETFDGRPWRGLVDAIAGGFPCQDISPAGKRAGITGARSSLWSEYARIIGEVRPAFVFVENVAQLVRRGLEVVLGDLAALGFDAEWDVFRASDVGAPHKRARLFLLAYAQGFGEREPDDETSAKRRRWPWEGAGGDGGTVAHSNEPGQQGERLGGVPDRGGADSGTTLTDSAVRSGLPHLRRATAPIGGGQTADLDPSEPVSRRWLVVAFWPTPRASDGTKGSGESDKRQGGPSLVTKAKCWPTPAARDWRDGRSNQHGKNARPLNEVAVMSRRGPRDQKTSKDGASTSPSGPVLNPRFVEALMGWPIGWTNCDSWETVSCRPSPRLRSASSRRGR